MCALKIAEPIPSNREKEWEVLAMFILCYIEQKKCTNACYTSICTLLINW